MANYNPPTENLPIFDINVFKTADSYITQADADKRYLKYPNAQGTENLAQINVNGTATFFTTTLMKKPLQLNSTTDTDREIQNTTYTMIDKTGNTAVGKIYADNGDFYYDSDINSKNHYFLGNNGSGVQTTLLQMNTNNFVINSVNLPTAPLASLPASSDSSDKIPTTAWVQTAISDGGSTITQKFTASGTTTTPANCRFVDIMVVGYGGICGVPTNTNPVWYGGTGSGGNMAIISGAPMEGGLSLKFTFNSTSGTGSVLLQYLLQDGITYSDLCRVYNGNKGTDGQVNIVAAGGTVNTTPTTFNSNFGNWFTANGKIGTVGSSPNAPVLTGTEASTPRGTISWGVTKLGCGQRIQSEPLQTGFVSITYHCA